MTNRKGLRIGLTVLSVLGAFFSLPMVMMSPMIFDAPGATESPTTLILFYSVLAFPVLCLAGGILPWIFKRHRFGIWLYALSGLAIGLIFVAVVLLEVMCSGDFSC